MDEPDKSGWALVRFTFVIGLVGASFVLPWFGIERDVTALDGDAAAIRRDLERLRELPPEEEYKHFSANAQLRTSKVICREVPARCRAATDFVATLMNRECELAGRMWSRLRDDVPERTRPVLDRQVEVCAPR